MAKRKAVRRRRSVSGMSVPKKITTGHLKGAAVEIAAEAAIDHFTGGILTDATGRWIKIVGGLYLLTNSRKQSTQGMGLGLVTNNAYAKFVSPSNETLGDMAKNTLLSATGIQGIGPAYRQNYLNGVNGIEPLQRNQNAGVVENFG